MKRIPRSVIALFCAFSALQASAQQRITFGEAVQIALEQSSQIRMAENQLGLQDVRVRQSRMAFLPSLSLSTGASRNWGNYQDPTTYELRTNVTESASLNANTNLTLFDGFGNTNRLRSSRAQLEQQEYALERSHQQVVYDVIARFMEYTLALDNVRIEEENVADQQAQVAHVEGFVRMGQRSASELHTQRATLADAELSLLTAENSLEVARTRIIQTLQLDPFQDYEFVVPMLEDLALTPVQYVPEQMLRSAFANRPDLKASQSAIESAEYELKAAQGGRLPSLSLSGGIGSGWSSSRPLGFQDQLEANRNERLSFSVSVPLFNRMNTRTQIESSRVQYENQLYDLEVQQHEIAVNIRQAYIDYQTLIKKLDVTEIQLEQARQALEIEQESYTLGSATLLEVNQAQAAFVRAARLRSQAIVEFHFQRLIIEFYQGTLNPNGTLFGG